MPGPRLLGRSPPHPRAPRPPPAPSRCPCQVEPGSKIKFGRVLALKQGGKFEVGKPYLEGAAVEAEVLEELKAPKVGARAVGAGPGPGQEGAPLGARAARAPGSGRQGGQ
jgi:hypothetical protein